MIEYCFSRLGILALGVWLGGWEGWGQWGSPSHHAGQASAFSASPSFRLGMGNSCLVTCHRLAGHWRAFSWGLSARGACPPAAATRPVFINDAFSAHKFSFTRRKIKFSLFMDILPAASRSKGFSRHQKLEAQT